MFMTERVLRIDFDGYTRVRRSEFQRGLRRGGSGNPTSPVPFLQRALVPRLRVPFRKGTCAPAARPVYKGHLCRGCASRLERALVSRLRVLFRRGTCAPAARGRTSPHSKQQRLRLFQTKVFSKQQPSAML